MRSHSCVGQSVELGQRGAWRFTLELVVERELILVFSELYEAAFGALRTRSMARQVLSEDEFAAQMVNPRVRKYVAWTADAVPVGMCVVTTDLTTVPWISPEYFAARYPAHWERHAIWYINFLLAHPSQRHGRFLDHIIDVGVGELVEAEAICAYDMCSYNEDDLGLGRRVAESFRRTTGATPARTDVQSYYTVDFSATAEPGGATGSGDALTGGSVGDLPQNPGLLIGPAAAGYGQTVGTL